MSRPSNGFRIIFLLLPMALFGAVKANADCCGIPLGGWYTCQDGTSSGGGCCGVGPCNILCCNCDGGCRVSHNRTECYAWCQSNWGICDNGCTIACTGMKPWECQPCYDKCRRELDDCKRDCDRRFPTKKAQGGLSEEASNFAEALRRFSLADKDQDGVISQTEFDAFVQQQAALLKCQGTAALSAMDQDGNGRLTLDEVDRDGASYLQSLAPSTDQKPKPQAEYIRKVAKAMADAKKTPQ